MFSALDGPTETHHNRAFDERDDEDRAIRVFLMGAPLVEEASSVTEDEYDRLLAEYRMEFKRKAMTAK